MGQGSGRSAHWDFLGLSHLLKISLRGTPVAAASVNSRGKSLCERVYWTRDSGDVIPLVIALVEVVV